MLLFWISLISVFLNVLGDTTNNDYSKICDQCNDTTVPICPKTDPLPYNMTIYCQQSVDKPCSIGIVEANNETNDTADYICLLSHRETLTNMLAEDGINVVSIVKETLTTMLPLPLAMQTTATKTIAVTTPLYDEVPEDEKQHQETSSEPLPTMAVLEVTEMTIKPVHGSYLEDPIVESSMPEMQPIEKDIAETITKPQDELELQTTSVANLMKPAESLDYQSDDPHSEITVNDVATPDENKIEMEEMAKPVEDDVIKDIQIVVVPEKEEIMNISADKNIDIETLYKEKVPSSTTALNENSITASTSSVSAEMHTCFSCTSTTDKNCVTKPVKEISCKSMEGTQKGCYTLFEDNKVQRGCSSELSTTVLSTCLKETNKTCRMCEGDACNSRPWPQCYNCRSEDSKPACAWFKEDEPNAMQTWTSLCAGRDDVCITYIDSSGATVRGCASQTKQCAKDESATCQTCASTLCNAGVFPKFRRRCHQCTGTETCAEQQVAERALACPRYQLDEDNCLFYVNSTGKMQRGCTSSSRLLDDCKTSGGDNRCVICTDADGCNSTPLMVKPTLSCSRCDSRQNNANTTPGCAWAQSSESVSTCSNRYLYYLEQTCQMIYQPDVELVVRGCSLDMGACEPTNPWCQTCNASACNTINLKWEYCLQCSSVETPSCGSDAEGIKPTKCKSSVQPFETRGCYTSQSVATNLTTRGCISDLPEEGMIYCQTHKKLCSLCYDRGCNNRLASSGASRVADLKAIISPLVIISMVSFLKSL